VRWAQEVGPQTKNISRFGEVFFVCVCYTVYMEDVSNYEKLKADTQSFYTTIGRVFSPAFGQEIHFPSEGFNHIVFKGNRSEREKSSQMLRFKLLPLAVKLVKLATTYQEYEETIREFEVK